MLSMIKAFAIGTAFAFSVVATGGLSLLALLAWQAYSDPFFDKR